MAWQCIKNPKIRDIITILGNCGPHTPTQLAKKMDLHEVTVSRYLKTLKDENLVKIKRKQNQLFYSLNVKQWEKHIEATINLAGTNFANKFNEHTQKESHSSELNKSRK